MRCTHQTSWGESSAQLPSVAGLSWRWVLPCKEKSAMPVHGDSIRCNKCIGGASEGVYAETGREVLGKEGGREGAEEGEGERQGEGGRERVAQSEWYACADQEDERGMRLCWHQGSIPVHEE